MRYLILIISITLVGKIYSQDIKKSFGMKYSLTTSDRNYSDLLNRGFGGRVSHIRFYQNFGMSYGMFYRVSIHNWDINLGPNLLLRRWSLIPTQAHSYFPDVNPNSYVAWQKSNLWMIEMPLTIGIPVKLSDGFYLKPTVGYSLDYLILPQKDLIYRTVIDSGFAEVLKINKSKKFNHAILLGLGFQTKTSKAGSIEILFLAHFQTFTQIYFSHGANPEGIKTGSFPNGIDTDFTNRHTTSYSTLGLSWCFPY
jgi:hypothetical protein